MKKKRQHGIGTWEQVLLHTVKDLNLHARFFHARKEVFNADMEDWTNVLRGCVINALKRGQIGVYCTLDDGNPVMVDLLISCNAITKCTLVDEENKEWGVGYAFCTDNFWKLKGRVISLKRALVIPQFVRAAEEQPLTADNVVEALVENEPFVEVTCED